MASIDGLAPSDDLADEDFDLDALDALLAGIPDENEPPAQFVLGLPNDERMTEAEGAGFAPPVVADQAPVLVRGATWISAAAKDNKPLSQASSSDVSRLFGTQASHTASAHSTGQRQWTTADNSRKPTSQSAISNDDTEPISGLKIQNRTVPMLDVQRALAGRKVIKVAELENFAASRVGATSNSVGWASRMVQGKPRDTLDDVYIIGVLGEKSLPRASNGGSGGNYQAWNLTDYRSSVTVLLFGEAYSEHWQEAQGSIVLLSQPDVLRSDDGKRFTFSVRKGAQLTKLGTSPVLGVCRGTKKEGGPCRMIVDKTKTGYCTYHASAALAASTAQYSQFRSQPRGGPPVGAVKNTNVSAGSYGSSMAAYVNELGRSGVIMGVPTGKGAGQGVPGIGRPVGYTVDGYAMHSVESGGIDGFGYTGTPAQQAAAAAPKQAAPPAIPKLGAGSAAAGKVSRLIPLGVPLGLTITHGGEVEEMHRHTAESSEGKGKRGRTVEGSLIGPAGPPSEDPAFQAGAKRALISSLKTSNKEGGSTGARHLAALAGVKGMTSQSTAGMLGKRDTDVLAALKQMQGGAELGASLPSTAHSTSKALLHSLLQATPRVGVRINSAGAVVAAGGEGAGRGQGVRQRPPVRHAFGMLPGPFVPAVVGAVTGRAKRPRDDRDGARVVSYDAVRTVGGGDGDPLGQLLGPVGKAIRLPDAKKQRKESKVGPPLAVMGTGGGSNNNRPDGDKGGSGNETDAPAWVPMPLAVANELLVSEEPSPQSEEEGQGEGGCHVGPGNKALTKGFEGFVQLDEDDEHEDESTRQGAVSSQPPSPAVAAPRQEKHVPPPPPRFVELQQMGPLPTVGIPVTNPAEIDRLRASATAHKAKAKMCALHAAGVDFKAAVANAKAAAASATPAPSASLLFGNIRPVTGAKSPGGAAVPRLVGQHSISKPGPKLDAAAVLASAHSRHEDDAADEAFNRLVARLNGREKSEELEAQMREMTSRTVTRFMCETCDRTFAKSPTMCEADGHAVVSFKRTEWAFKCVTCRHKIMHASQSCALACPNCSKRTWEHASVHRLKEWTERPGTESELQARGEEQINSLRFS